MLEQAGLYSVHILGLLLHSSREEKKQGGSGRGEEEGGVVRMGQAEGRREQSRGRARR